MMTTADCPRCNDPVTLPANLHGSSRVRCPLCYEEFLLAEITDHLPPKLEVLEAVAAEPEAVSVETRHSAEQGLKGLPPDFFGESSADEVPVASELGEAPEDESSFDFEVDDSPDASSPATGKYHANQAKRRAGKNPLVEAGKIVAGGVVGLILAVLIMWWGLGRDPFELGPTVARYVPFVVPSTFHGQQQEGETLALQDSPQPTQPAPEDSPGAETGAERGRNGMGMGGMGGTLGRSTPSPPDEVPDFADFDSGIRPEDSLEFFDDEDLSPAELTDDVNDEDAQFPFNLTDDELFGELDVPAIELEPDFAFDEPSDPTLDDLPDLMTSPLTAEQVADARREAERANSAWDEYGRLPQDQQTREQRRQRALQFYSSFAQLGHAVTFADASDPQMREQIGEVGRFLSELRHAPIKQQLIVSGSKSWLRLADRPGDGVAVIGTVEEIDRHGAMYATRLAIAPDEGLEVVVVSHINPANYYDYGSRVFFLGTFIDHPQAVLAGFDDEQSQVIMGGFPLLLDES